jgi:hypothetical protein
MRLKIPIAFWLYAGLMLCMPLLLFCFVRLTLEALLLLLSKFNTPISCQKELML